MTYPKTFINKIMILSLGFILVACGGGTSSTDLTSIDDTNADPTDLPVFDRALASRAPNFSPSGNITDTNPTFTWTVTQGATKYIIGHEDTDSTINWTQYKLTSTEASCSDSCQFTPNDFSFSVGDEKVWWVRAKTDSGWQDWSKGYIFEIVDLPDNDNNLPEIISPIGNNIALNPEFSWTAVPTATNYEFGYENPNTESNWNSFTVNTNKANCASSESICSYTPADSGLASGDIRRLWVRAKIDGIWSEWSEGVDFSIGNTTTVERPFIIKVKPFRRFSSSPVIKDYDIYLNPKFTYNYNVDCDSDGILEGENLSTSFTCNYDYDESLTPELNDEHRISISGNFPAFYQQESIRSFETSSRMVIDVEQWGSQVWKSMEQSFLETKITTLSATDTPNISEVTTTHKMFHFAVTANPDLSNWDVSNVTDMSDMFSRAESFNSDISNWDVSNVTNMSNMFSFADNFNNDISSWDVGNVTNMFQMFAAAYKFNKDIGSWNVENVTNMRSLFSSTEAFNQDLSSWDVSNVTDMSRLFNDATAFNSNISSWDVSNVVNMESMFSSSSIFNQDIGDWDVSNVTNMESMFFANKKFNQDIGSWDISNVSNMRSMFYATDSFNQDIGNWDVSNVITMSDMFNSNDSFNQDISNWDVSNVITMSGMFYGAVSFNKNISNWDVSNVIDMYYMFYDAKSFNTNIGNWDVSNVTNMSNILTGSGLSTNKYDKLLIKWSDLPLKSNIKFDAVNLKYSSAASAARSKLINDFGWTISDGGLLQ